MARPQPLKGLQACKVDATVTWAYHETGEGREHVDGWVDLPVLQLPVHVHLALCDVACQVRNGMCDVIIGHGQDGQLSDGPLPPLNTPSPLVDGGKICVHVTCGTRAPVSRPAGQVLCTTLPANMPLHHHVWQLPEAGFQGLKSAWSAHKFIIRTFQCPCISKALKQRGMQQQAALRGHHL